MRKGERIGDKWRKLDKEIQNLAVLFIIRDMAIVVLCCMPAPNINLME